MERDPEERTIILVNLPQPERPLPNPENFQKCVDWSVNQYDKQLDMMEWLEDDGIPHIYPYTGTEIFAEAFGCKVYRSEDNMPFALPFIQKPGDLLKIKPPDVYDSTLGDIFERAMLLRQRVGNDTIIKLPDVQSPLDIAALIWEKESFFIAMIDDPAAVKELTDMTEHLLTTFLDEWFRIFGNRYIAHFPDYYMEGGITLSEDEIGGISTAMFEEFCLAPSLNRLSERYGGIGIHCCANAQHQWNNLLKIKKLRLINLVQPPDITFEAYKRFAPYCCQYHDWVGYGEPSIDWVDNYPKESHLIISCYAANKEEAITKVKLLKSIVKERNSGY